METKLNAPFCPALTPNLLYVLAKISTNKNRSIKFKFLVLLMYQGGHYCLFNISFDGIKKEGNP